MRKNRYIAYFGERAIFLGEGRTMFIQVAETHDAFSRKEVRKKTGCKDVIFMRHLGD